MSKDLFFPLDRKSKYPYVPEVVEKQTPSVTLADFVKEKKTRKVI